MREDEGELVFTGVRGDPRGTCCLTDVQGYSVEPPPPTPRKPAITIIDATRKDPGPPTMDEPHAEVWIVSVRSKKDQHRVQGANVKKDGDKLIFTDLQGSLTGCFCRAEVEIYLVAPVTVGAGAGASITVIIDGAPSKPEAPERCL